MCRASVGSIKRRLQVSVQQCCKVQGQLQADEDPPPSTPLPLSCMLPSLFAGSHTHPPTVRMQIEEETW